MGKHWAPISQKRYLELLEAEAALIVAQTARATAEAERAHYHDLWVAACAARDAAEEEMRELCKEMQAERDETLQIMIGWQHKAEAALAAQAQAAPVLAALERWVDTGHHEKLLDAVADWRAAREG